MGKTENGITPFQLFFVISQTTMGVVVLSLPYDIFQISKNDAWISIILAGIVIEIGILTIWLLHTRFPSLTIYEMLNRICGRPFGMIGKAAYILYFVFIALYVALIFGYLVNVWILIRTPIWITMFMLIAISWFCAKKNLRVIARFYTIISVLFVVTFFLFLYVLKDANYLLILPIGENGIPAIAKGAVQATLAFSGFEIVLVLFPLTLGKSAKKLKVSLLAIGFITLFYTFLTLVCLSFLGPSVMKFIPQPLLYVLKYQTFRVVERTDLLFFSIWTTSVTTSMIMYFYLSAVGIANVFKKSDHSSLVLIVAAVVFIGSLVVPVNDETLSIISDSYMKVSVFFLFIIPALLLLLSFVFRKKETERGTPT